MLIVEDDPVGQRVAAHLVKRLGYFVDVVPDGQAAIEAVAANSYALVLMDCQMPGVDGYMATAEIRRRESALGPWTRRVAIVALTASRLDSDRARCLAAGMDEYLTKPVDTQQLGALLERWVPGRDIGPQIASSQPLAPAESAALPPTELAAPPTRETCEIPPILDPAGLLGAGTALSPQHLEIVELFLEEVPRRLTALGVAAARGDSDQVARLAHTLAGSASSLGASRLAAACAQLEALARDERQPSGSGVAHGPDDGPGGNPDHRRLFLIEPRNEVPLTEAIDTVHRELRQLQAALAGDTAL